MIFGEVLRTTRQRNPSKMALVFAERQWTYAELDDLTDGIAAGLYAAGVRRDDRVALFMPNCPELVFSYLACFKLGAIAVPLNHRYRQPEAEYVLRHSGSTTLVVHVDKLADAIALPFDSLGIVRRYLVSGRPAVGGSSATAPSEMPFRPFESLADGNPVSLVAATFDERQLATIMYTSGTTAKPKGVVHSHETLWHCVQIQTASMGFTAEDVQLITTSACHCAATYGQIFPNIFAGGTAVLLDAPTPQQVVEAIVTHRVTRCQMLPASLQELVEYLEQHPTNLSSLRSFFAGGDVVPLDAHARFRAAVGIDVCEVCGMTEAITYTVNPPFGQKRLGSIGKPLRETQVRIADEHGRELPVGSQGEIWIKSPENMVGYWNDTLHTSATLHDGWLASGDLGRVDEDGYLWFVGRKKEIIVRGGSNISPLEVEEVIDQHPAVHISGVVGMPDKKLGQIVIAYVSLRPEAAPRPTPDDLRSFVAGRIAAYKVPEQFFLLDALPLNASNKVDRQKLHARVVADAQAASA
jgi:acyl-CoA synthetase (AMP-forming)/AMP-acid ligase II